MHMADALISPAVGGAMWAASAGMLGYCGRKVKLTLDDRLVPMMGVLGAFIFAAQMINFAIPATGSSGHLGGGLLLAILLGPEAAFLVLASVLTVQALFFADGGLLALGCNIWNLGFYPAFIAYPLIYKPLLGNAGNRSRAMVAVMVAAVVGLQLGAFSVVLETTWSGIAELRFTTFALLMQPIHLAIGVVEGLATAAVVAFVVRARPEAVRLSGGSGSKAVSLRPVLTGLLVATVLLGGLLSWFASTRPDGLEWSIAKLTGQGEIVAGSGAHQELAKIQEKTALLPDYGFKTTAPETATAPVVRGGRTVAGLVGGVLVLALAGLVGYGLSKRRRAA